MKTYLFGILALLLVACKQAPKQVSPKKMEKETIIYYTYGELPPAGYIYYDTIFVMPKFKFEVKNMGGCEPNGVDYDNLERRNKKTVLYMNKHYGKNWANDLKQQTKLKLILPLD